MLKSWRAVVPVAVLVVAWGSSSEAQPLSGRWAGMARQVDSEPYGVTVVIDQGGAGTIDYHELVCGGTLTPIGTDGSATLYRERITYGRGRCTDGGRVRTAAEGNAMTWSWFDEGKATANVTATLTRKASARTPLLARPKTGCDQADDLAPNERLAWEGSCANGRAEGRGTLQWFKDDKPATRYEGEFRDGNLNGRGAFTMRNGDRYEGEFRDGDLNGRGLYTAAKGGRYEGGFRDGKFDGAGAFSYATGGRYDGEWREGRFNGRGVFAFANGNRYEGEWRNGKPNGSGTYVRSGDGGTYSGTWTNGCFRQGDRWTTLGATAEECGFK